MATVTRRGEPVETSGELPTQGSPAPAFQLVKDDLSEITLSELHGANVILNIFPSIDTPTCQMSVRTFNQRASSLENTCVICVSADLPFAQKRFCGSEGIEDVITASTFRSPEFGKDYGLTLMTGPLKGLLTRAVVVISTNGKIIHTEMVKEIGSEPDYDTAIVAL
jgi:thiol peroxidase